MRNLFLLLVAVVCHLGAYVSAQWTTPLPVPDTLSGPSISLTIDSANYQFYPGGDSIATFCYNNAGFLGPTLIWYRGDSQSISIKNNLGTSTTVHWHGAHVPAIMDGGPHQGIAAGATWPVNFEVMDRAATMWYHPHRHMQTTAHVQMGLAGFIIIRDPADDSVATALPHTYGVDDYPIVIQDRSFAGGMILTHIDTCLVADSILINGQLQPTVTVPAQQVRFRVLNGSTDRSYQIGFNSKVTAEPIHDINMNLIATDAGYYAEPYEYASVPIVNGERYEMVVDLSGMEGDTIYMVNKADSLPHDIPGGFGSAADGVLDGSCDTPGDFDTTTYPILQIIVGPQTTNPTPILTLPTALELEEMPTRSIDTSRTKNLVKDLSLLPNPPFSIDSTPFDHGFINDTIMLGAFEEWTINNTSSVMHPWHIHDTHFWVTSVDSSTNIPRYLRGPKDVVMVRVNQPVVYRAEFLDFATAVPDTHQTYMEHCHILTHEDGGMMHQFAVIDTVMVSQLEEIKNEYWQIAPNPTTGNLSIKAQSKYPSTIRIFDIAGRLVSEDQLPPFQGSRDLRPLTDQAKGLYIVRWERRDGTTSKKVILR